jgi:hypothetical protein
MNTLLKSLLKDNKRILQSLHACIGLDFKKPYYIFDIEGKFTINQIIKAAAGAGYTPKKDIFVIFTRTETGFYTNYRVAVLDSSGNMEKDINSTGYNNNKFVSLDTFYTKSDFETVRKSAAHTIVICQNRDFLSIPARKNIDSMQRLKLLKAQINTPYNSTEKCIYSLNMQTTDNNGLNYQLDTYRYNTMDINTLIDKSGYLLIYRRETLRRRAAILRAEKAKNAYIAIDNTDKINALKAAILDKKNNVINMLMEATTAADLASVNKKLDYFHGIEGIFRSFERLENSDKNKEYKSIDNFMNEYNDIYTRLNAI